MRKVSWILLAVLGLGTLLVSFVSASLAYRGNYPIGGTPVTEIAQGREAVLIGLRGVRGTSAAFGAAFAVLLLFIVTGPYRSGEKWAWWAIFCAYLLLATVVVLRIPLVGGQLGIVPALLQVAVAGVGLACDARRLWTSAD